MKSIKKTSIIITFLSLIVSLSFAEQDKVLQIFRNGEVISEYSIDEIDYIEVNDLVQAPTDVNASVIDNQITIRWNPVEGATYNIYRSPDNVNFALLASKLTETTYADTNPLRGSNFYRVKAVVGDVESGYTSSAAATLTSSELENGIYLGLTGFNQALYEYPVLQLTENSVDGFRNFVDGLTMKNGTLLYYSVDQALNTMQSTELPSDITTAAIVTFTDGLDQGSFMMEGVSYDDEMAYLDALNLRIKTETISGQPITAYSIGIRGKDVSDINMFRTNLAKLASSTDNATEVTSMAEVNAKFKEIAEQLSQSNYIQTINLKMPGLSNGTRVRFTFDNVNAANKSQIYIEGKFNLKDKSLEEVQYVGLTSTSGTTVKGKVDGIFVNFTFDGVHTDNNILIKSEFTDEWTYIPSNDTWQINSEFDKTENSDIVTECSSAVIMLVLDCSSSLANDFIKAQTNANDFISTLYQAVGGTENPGENEETIYSTTPTDLSLAIWKDGTRYYLTHEQYRNANLNNIIVEGLTIIGGGESFILSLNDIQTDPIFTLSTAKELYGVILPTQNQGKIISARWTDINNALYSFGGSKLVGGESHSYYTSSTTYSSGSYYPWESVIFGSGGSLSTSKDTPYIRGVYSTNHSAPIVWTDPDDLKLSVIMNGERVYLNKNEYSQNISNIETVEGVLIIAAGEKFIISLNDAQSTSISNVSTAKQLYLDVMPTQNQGKIISARWTDINNALHSFGGGKLVGGESHSYYTSSTTYSSGDYYPWGAVIYGSGGSLSTSIDAPYIRGVITLQ